MFCFNSLSLMMTAKNKHTYIHTYMHVYNIQRYTEWNFLNIWNVCVCMNHPIDTCHHHHWSKSLALVFFSIKTFDQFPIDDDFISFHFSFNMWRAFVFFPVDFFFFINLLRFMMMMLYEYFAPNNHHHHH